MPSAKVCVVSQVALLRRIKRIVDAEVDYSWRGSRPSDERLGYEQAREAAWQSLMLYLAQRMEDRKVRDMKEFKE